MAAMDRVWHVVVRLSNGSLYSVSTHSRQASAVEAARMVNDALFPTEGNDYNDDRTWGVAVVMPEDEIVDLGETLIV